MESIRFLINKNKYYLTQHIKNVKARIPTLKEKIKLFLENSYHIAKPYKKNLTMLFIIIAVVAFLIKPSYHFFYNYVFVYPIDRVSQYNITNVTEKASLENQYRTTSIQLLTTLGQIFGGFAILIGTGVAWGNLTVAREGQITERFTRAVGQLGNQAPEIRLGGIHALGRISEESKKYYLPIMMILTDYIRINSSVYNHLQYNYGKNSSISMDILANETITSKILEGVVSSDIQAVLAVIGEHKSFFHDGKDKRLDLNETFLRGANLSGLHLEGVLLNWANLEWARLIKTHLDEAYLNRANLKYAYLSWAELKGASLEQADLSQADLSLANLKEAKLKKAILKKAILTDANLEKANLDGANLEGAILFLANLQGANLDEANLEGALLRLAHTEEAQFRGANLEGANLDSAFLEKAFFTDANLKKANLLNANLKEAILGDTNLENATLMNANLKKANLLGAKLTKANLIGANLEGAFLYDADLRGANLVAVNLEGAQLRGANFEGADLKGANLREADFDGANLKGANLEEARLDNADLRRARNLSTDQISEVKSFRGAKIDEKLRIRLADTH